MKAPENPMFLLPLDGSALAERAIWLAATLAERMDGRVLLLNVPEVYGLDPSWYSGATVDASAPMVPVEDLLSETRGESERYLAEKAESLASQGVDVETLILEDAPARAIVDTAEERDAWMVVMATHGWGGVTRWALGSVADKTLHTSRRPVAIVRADAEHIDPKLDQLMIALDGSREAEAVLERTWPMARALGSHVTLVHVVVEPTIALSSADLLEAEAAHRARMERYFQSRAAEMGDDGIACSYELLTGEDPAETLLARQEQDDVDLFAITTHGHGGLSRWAFGSVADRILRSANTPVLVQRIG